MHGLKTIHLLNQRNAEAERIMAKYAKQDGRTILETQDRTANNNNNNKSEATTERSK